MARKLFNYFDPTTYPTQQTKIWGRKNICWSKMIKNQSCSEVVVHQDANAPVSLQYSLMLKDLWVGSPKQRRDSKCLAFLQIYFQLYQSVFLFVPCPSTCLLLCMSLCLSVCLSIYMFCRQTVSLSVCLSFHLTLHISVCLFICCISCMQSLSLTFPLSFSTPRINLYPVSDKN